MVMGVRDSALQIGSWRDLGQAGSFIAWEAVTANSGREQLRRLAVARFSYSVSVASCDSAGYTIGNGR